MRCECEGTWRHPCLKCYRQQLAARNGQQDEGPSPDELEAALGRAGVPGNVLEGLRGQLYANANLTAARAFYVAPAKTQRTLVLLGPAGRGKSLAAAWVMREVLKQDGWNNAPTGAPPMPVQFLPAANLTRLSGYDKLDSEWMDQLGRVKLLVVDDAGDEASAIGIAALGNLLKQRHNRMRRSIITSNLRKPAFGARYGMELMDRAEAEGRVVESAGASMRHKPEVRT
jgi:DNA replication protein DnaC